MTIVTIIVVLFFGMRVVVEVVVVYFHEAMVLTNLVAKVGFGLGESIVAIDRKSVV